MLQLENAANGLKPENLKPLYKLSKPTEEVKFSLGATLCILDKDEQWHNVRTELENPKKLI